jgi:hypothetical protein
VHGAAAAAWGVVQQHIAAASLAAGFEREVVAIDSKTLRRSFDRKHERAPLHLVSAWASAQGLVLGQRCVEDKSNEITAVPSRRWWNWVMT